MKKEEMKNRTEINLLRKIKSLDGRKDILGDSYHFRDNGENINIERKGEWSYNRIIMKASTRVRKLKIALKFFESLR